MSRFTRHTTDQLVARRPGRVARELMRLPVVVVLDNVRSAHNVGLVFRLCDSVGVNELWLGGITAYPGVSERADNRMAKTAVGGSLHTVPWTHHEDPTPAVRRLKERGWRVVALEQGDGSSPWDVADYTLPLVLALGHEREGVRDELLQEADEVAELPMRGITNSLNVALAAGAVLYHVLARERRRGRRDVEVGLCDGCVHARVIRSDRGSAFLRCTAAESDPSLPRYPRLPVSGCHGFQDDGTLGAED